MTYAYWYVVAAIFLPYIFTVLAKAAHPEFSNRTPRDYLESLEGWRKRSHWVQLNSFEIFGPFAASVIIAHQLNAPQQLLDLWALLFVIARVLYGFFYVFDKSSLRSLSFFASLGCIIAIFVII